MTYEIVVSWNNENGETRSLVWSGQAEGKNQALKASLAAARKEAWKEVSRDQEINFRYKGKRVA